MDSAIFCGWQVLDLVVSEGGQFRNLFFSGSWHIGKFGGGKKDDSPCTCENCENYLCLLRRSEKLKNQIPCTVLYCTVRYLTDLYFGQVLRNKCKFTSQRTEAQYSAVLSATELWIVQCSTNPPLTRCSNWRLEPLPAGSGERPVCGGRGLK